MRRIEITERSKCAALLLSAACEGLAVADPLLLFTKHTSYHETALFQAVGYEYHVEILTQHLFCLICRFVFY